MSPPPPVEVARVAGSTGGGHARPVTDEALRRSARAAAGAGDDDVAARARLLGDELRAGLRSRGDVELLAYLADPAALLLLDEPEPDLSGEDGPVLWTRGFLAWGPEVLARAVVAWLWAGVVAEDERFHDAVRAWWRTPGAQEARRAVGAMSAGHTAAVYLCSTVEEHAAGKVEETLQTIEVLIEPLAGDEFSRPSPELLARRFEPWLAQRRPMFPQLPGDGPVAQRAIDHVTPPARRELVAHLRANLRRLVPLVVRGQAADFRVEGVSFDQLSGHLHGTLPMALVDLDQVSRPSA